MQKSKTRLFVEKQISQNLMIYIKEKQLHFLKNVLRVKLDDFISIFDGNSGEWNAKIISISKEKIALKVLKKIKEFEHYWPKVKIDLIENIQICLMLNQFPDISIAQVEFANGTTMLKHLLVKVLYACIIFLAIFKIGKKVLPK